MRSTSTKENSPSQASGFFTPFSMRSRTSAMVASGRTCPRTVSGLMFRARMAEG